MNLDKHKYKKTEMGYIRRLKNGTACVGKDYASGWNDAIDLASRNFNGGKLDE